MKEEKNYFLGLIFFFVLFVVIIFFVLEFFIWMGHFTSSLPLSRIVITGKRIYTTDNDVRRSVLNSGLVGTFITQDLQCLQEQIKKFSWIKQVSVRKQWPNKIKIHIIEYIPVARWNYIYMVTKEAVIFTVPEWRINNRESFPLLLGPLGRERDVLMNYYVFNEVFRSTIFKIGLVSMDSRYSWQIVLNNGVRLILGREINVARLQRFMKIYPIFLKKYMDEENECISYIDLRYESGFSVKKMPIIKKIN